MKAFLNNHPILKWTAAAILSLVLVLVIALALFDWNSLRAPISRIISAKTGHPTSIDGNLSAHIWSWNPSFTAEDLTVRNPEWASRHELLSVRKITLQVSLGHLLLGKLVLPRVELLSPVVDLERDASGRASWNAPTTPAKPAKASPHLPAVQRLLIQDGKIHVV